MSPKKSVLVTLLTLNPPAHLRGWDGGAFGVSHTEPDFDHPSFGKLEPKHTARTLHRCRVLGVLPGWMESIVLPVTPNV